MKVVFWQTYEEQMSVLSSSGGHVVNSQRPHQAAVAFPPSPLAIHMARWPVNPWKTCEVDALTGFSLFVCRKIWPLVAPGAEKTDCGLNKDGQIEL